MKEFVFALFFLYVPAFALILFLLWQRYRAGEADTGAVLLHLRPVGLRLVVLLSALAFFLLAVAFSFLTWGRFRTGAATRLQQSALVTQGILVFAFGMLSIRICENGLVDESGFLAWDAVAGYERRRSGRFLLHLKAGRSGRLLRRRTLGLSCPPALDESLGAILLERIG